MKAALTWKNLAIVVFVLPIRTILLTLFWVISWIGEQADRMWWLVADKLPALEVDREWERQQHEQQRKRVLGEYFKLAQKANKSSNVVGKGRCAALYRAASSEGRRP